MSAPDARALLEALDELANQLCVAVDGDFDFAVRATLENEVLEKLSMLINFVLDTARRGMSALQVNNAALSELDRAKTAFFSNVSHEFRTPLTLMLGPLEDALAGAHGELAPPLREQLVVAHRNALRLLKLVNALLEFSRIEAGRAHAVYEPTDLATLTRELASGFRSAIERAGLRFVVDCPPLPWLVPVDHEMWEKIVLNLLSNALKFTFDGEITLRLRPAGELVELEVRDTGVGIAREHLPSLFKRFHRVTGARSRSHEGAGIGLALVQELARLHGGSVHVESEPAVGSAFVVKIPAVATPAAPVAPAAPAAPVAPAARPATEQVAAVVATFTAEAQAWVASPKSSADASDASGVSGGSGGSGERVLVVDDNSDMRGYLCRILEEQWSVETATDGAEALEAARRSPPDLVVTDAMMPVLDGVGFLRALRADERTRAIPVVMLSARAGEEAAIEGIDAGADDFLVKPFSPRELVARVGSHLALARARRAAVTAREAHLQREREERHLNETLYRVATTFARELEPRALVRLVSDEATALIGAEFGAFFLDVEREDGEAYRLRALTGAPPDAFTELPSPRTPPLSAPTFRGEGVIRLDDVRSGARPRPRHGTQDGTLDGTLGAPPFGHLPVVSYLAVPVVGAGGKVVGSLYFGHSEASRFAEMHERIVLGLAGQAAASLEKALLYEQLRASEERARDADRQKDEFLAMLGHELRNPLAPIQTALHLMRLRGASDSVREREVIERQVRHMVGLVDDLLDIARVTRGKIELAKERVELGPIVARAVEIAVPLFELRKHTLRVDVPAQGLLVEADPMRLAQVVANLLTNAAKYTPPGGHVSIVGRRSGSARIELAVEDNGQGIAAELLPHIFDLFTQGKRTPDRAEGGLGLGLALARNLVELHGGTISARSEGPGRGSVFTLALPAPPGDAAPRGAAARLGSLPDIPAAALGARILIVDDNEDAAEVLGDALELLGHEIRIAHDGPGALAAAASFPATIAILDIGLPVMDGYELVGRLREVWRDRDVRYIALTGYGQGSDRAKALAAGFDHHLVKPIDLTALTGLLAGPGESDGTSRPT